MGRAIGEKVLGEWDGGPTLAPALRYWVGTLECSGEKAGWTARLVKNLQML